MADALAASAKDDLLDWGATLAFYFLFAFFPTILLVAAALSDFHLRGLIGNLTAALTHNLPHQAAQLVAEQLRELLRKHASGLLSVNIVIPLYAASQGFSGLMTALDVAYEVRETRSYLHRLGLAFALTFSAGIFIALALAVLLLGERTLALVAGPAHLARVLEMLWPLIRWAFTLAMMALALAVLYRVVPNCPKREGHGTLPGRDHCTGHLGRCFGAAIDLHQTFRDVLGGLRLAGRGDRADALDLRFRAGDSPGRGNPPCGTEIAGAHVSALLPPGARASAANGLSVYVSRNADHARATQPAMKQRPPKGVTTPSILTPVTAST